MILESKWKEIKEYFNYCDNGSFVAKKMSVSQATANRVRRSSSYDDYKRIVKEESITKKDRSTSDSKPQTMVVSYAQVKAIAKDINEIKQSLNQISAINNALLDIWKGR